jgi:hypothetical protein
MTIIGAGPRCFDPLTLRSFLYVLKGLRPSDAKKLLYVLKGLRPSDAKQFRIRASFQGEVEGKRVAVTQNIGPRARAGWIDAATKLGRNFDGEPKVSGSISSKSQPIGLASQIMGTPGVHT